MIRTVKVLFCDDEHGAGDVTFPGVRNLDPHDFIRGSLTTRELRRQAKAAGWSHRGGADYCDGCTAAQDDPLNNPEV